jgi:repressor LexA
MRLENDKAVKSLTRPQSRILNYILARVEKEGMPPTHDEIANEFGYRSSFSVRQHLRLIKNKGYIDLYPGKSRGIRVRAETASDSIGLIEVPIIGRIAAGRPILAEEHIERRISISADLFSRGVLFVLRVEGESMVNVGIRSGDMAVIRQQALVENGEIAAVLLHDEATLKRFYLRKNYVCLKAENDHVADIRVENRLDAQLRILGLYVGLIRQAR